MTNAQKSALAAALLSKAGDLVEFFTDAQESEPDLADVDVADAAAQLATWLRRLPGDTWDVRLPA